jgi:hypothetical protein
LFGSRVIRYTVSVYFKDEGRIPKLSELNTETVQGFEKGAEFYESYLKRLQKMKSPVFSTTTDIRFIDDTDELQRLKDQGEPAYGGGDASVVKIVVPALSGFFALLLGCFACRTLAARRFSDHDPRDGEKQRVRGDAESSTYISDYRTTAFSDDYNTLATVSNDTSGDAIRQIESMEQAPNISSEEEEEDLHDVSLDENDESRTSEKADPAGWSATDSVQGDELSVADSGSVSTEGYAHGAPIDSLEFDSTILHHTGANNASEFQSDTSYLQSFDSTDESHLGDASITRSTSDVDNGKVTAVGCPTPLQSETKPEISKGKLNAAIETFQKGVTPSKSSSTSSGKQYKWTVADPKALTPPPKPTTSKWPPPKVTEAAAPFKVIKPSIIPQTSSDDSSKPSWMAVKLRPVNEGVPLAGPEEKPSSEPMKGIVSELTKKFQEKEKKELI